MTRVTIGDVAKRAGVAISSVSSALNGRPGVSEATRHRIVAAADELGFVPSVRGRSLSGKRTFTVALVIHRDPTVLAMDPFFGSFIGGIETQIDDAGYALVLQTSASTDGVLDRYRRLHAERRADGVFLNELETGDPRIALVTELGLPAVGINPDPDFPLPAVTQDHTAGIREAVDHLVSLGHRRIDFVSGPAEFIHSHQREQAWREATTAAGLAPGRVAPGRFSYEGGAAAAVELLDRPDAPTAVLCANDLSAIGFIAAAQHGGRSVPDDLSVIGFDGIQLGEYVRPALTTIRTDPTGVGREAARLLLGVIDGDEPASVSVAPASLVVRDSTAAARN